MAGLRFFFALKVSADSSRQSLKNSINILKIEQMIRLQFRGVRTLLLLSVMLAAGCICCDAKLKKKVGEEYAPIDSVIKKDLGDSISGILLSPSSVVIQQILMMGDTVQVKESLQMSEAGKAIVTFLMASQDALTKRPVVFGRFSPSIRFVFYKNHSKTMLDIDFGTKQMCFYDENGKAIRMAALEDRKFIKLALLYFPSDEFLTHLIKHEPR